MINVMVDSNLMEVAGSKNEDKKLFSPREKSPGRRPLVTYTPDGRKLLDGIPVDEQEPEEMWEKTFVRAAAVHQVHKVVDSGCCDGEDPKPNKDNDHLPAAQFQIPSAENECKNNQKSDHQQN